jgi:hypothetical protein
VPKNEVMNRQLLPLASLLAVVTLSAGCELLNRDKDANPTGPGSTSLSLDVFAGTWTSTAAPAATTCGNIQYTVTPTGSSANVTFAAICAGNIQVNGTGAGAVKGATLEWSAQGLVGQGGVNCPFSFTNGKAVEDAAGIKVTYSGTVCGIPVSGTEIVRK